LGKKENVRIIRAGDYFGVEEFFTGQQNEGEFRTKDFCSIISIKREDFIELLIS
jgi:CRP-like cAMP-binding protein